MQRGTKQRLKIVSTFLHFGHIHPAKDRMRRSSCSNISSGSQGVDEVARRGVKGLKAYEIILWKPLSSFKTNPFRSFLFLEASSTRKSTFRVCGSAYDMV